MAEVNSHSDLETLAYELSLEVPLAGQNKQLRSLAIVKQIEAQCVAADDDRPLVDLVQTTLGKASDWQLTQPPTAGLLTWLEVDGFAWNGKLVPTSPERARLAPEVSAIESHLEAQGLVTALQHYRQATDNLALGNFEAANGQVRSFVENLVICLCKSVAGRELGDPSAALQHLRDKGSIDAGEFKVCRGFWDATHTNGPHHGLSKQEEAQFRFHVATALGRYLLRKLAPESTA